MQGLSRLTRETGCAYDNGGHKFSLSSRADNPDQIHVRRGRRLLTP
jgi:hypothetical protein